MIKHFISTLLAILVAGGIAYGIYEWKQTRDYRVMLASEAIRQITVDLDEIQRRVDHDVNTEYHLATLRLLTKRIEEAEAMLARLNRVKVEAEVIDQQREHVRFLRSIQNQLATKL